MSEVPKTFMELGKDKFVLNNSNAPRKKNPYQEEKDSTFTHANVEYDLNKVLKEVDADSPITVPVSDLVWILSFGKADKDRLEKANYNFPILVHKWKGKLAVIDGFHRLRKAANENVKNLKVKIVSDEVLNSAKL